MGHRTSAADSLSRWRTQTDAQTAAFTQLDTEEELLLRRLWIQTDVEGQTQALAQDLVIDGPQEELEYVD